LAVHPFARGQIEDAPDQLQAVVDGAVGDAGSAPVFNPRLQHTHVQLGERHRADPGKETLQTADIVGKTALVLMVEHEFGGGLLKGPCGPDTINSRLAGFFHLPC
jgi:hypothetical protein